MCGGKEFREAVQTLKESAKVYWALERLQRLLFEDEMLRRQATEFLESIDSMLKSGARLGDAFRSAATSGTQPYTMEHLGLKGQQLDAIWEMREGLAAALERPTTYNQEVLSLDPRFHFLLCMGKGVGGKNKVGSVSISRNREIDRSFVSPFKRFCDGWLKVVDASCPPPSERTYDKARDDLRAQGLAPRPKRSQKLVTP